MVGSQVSAPEAAGARRPGHGRGPELGLSASRGIEQVARPARAGRGESAQQAPRNSGLVAHTGSRRARGESRTHREPPGWGESRVSSGTCEAGGDPRGSACRQPGVTVASASDRYIGACTPVIIVRQCAPPSNQRLRLRSNHALEPC